MRFKKAYLLAITFCVVQSAKSAARAALFAKNHFSSHARQRMDERGISRADVERVIRYGDQYLMADDRILHIDLDLGVAVFAADNGTIITTMPDVDEEWLDHELRRRDATVYAESKIARIKAQQAEGKSDGEIREENESRCARRVKRKLKENQPTSSKEYIWADEHREHFVSGRKRR